MAHKHCSCCGGEEDCCPKSEHIHEHHEHEHGHDMSTARAKTQSAT